MLVILDGSDYGGDREETARRRALFGKMLTDHGHPDIDREMREMEQLRCLIMTGTSRHDS